MASYARLARLPKPVLAARGSSHAGPARAASAGDAPPGRCPCLAGGSPSRRTPISLEAAADKPSCATQWTRHLWRPRVPRVCGCAGAPAGDSSSAGGGSGPGLADAGVNLVPVPFYTTKPGGSGIGLVLSRADVSREGHGGSARAGGPARGGARCRGHRIVRRLACALPRATLAEKPSSPVRNRDVFIRVRDDVTGDLVLSG